MLKSIVIIPPSGRKWTMNDIWKIANSEAKKYLKTHGKVNITDLLWSDRAACYIAVFEAPDGRGVQSPWRGGKGKQGR